jgi:hypothetical protein
MNRYTKETNSPQKETNYKMLQITLFTQKTPYANI